MEMDAAEAEMEEEGGYDDGSGYDDGGGDYW